MRFPADYRRATRWATRAALASSIIAVASAVATSPAHTTEVDNFSGRETLTRDALPVLDAKINIYLDRAIRQANLDGRCNRVMLRQELVRWTGPDPVSMLELWTSFTDEIQRAEVSYRDSVYADAAFLDAPAVRVFGLGRSFKLAGTIVGTDKIGHFFMQGLSLFKRVKLDGADLAHVMNFENGEDGIWGLQTSGVYSYADMAANYAGYRFWNELYSGENPYVRCENDRRWIKAREFSWRHYVTDAWDEAINCSEFKPGLSATVAANLEKHRTRCPIDAAACLKITALEQAKLFVSPVCQELARSGLLPAQAGPTSPRGISTLRTFPSPSSR